MRWSTPLVVTTSATVLVTEIVAARMVAPYVGVTLETFTAVIGCVLVAIAAGNWLGGRLADRARPETCLAAALACGGLALGAAPTIVRALGPRLPGSTAVSATLLGLAAFALPCALLSTTTPIVVRHLGCGSTRLGRVAGNVSAFATIGALAGNFGAGFWLIGRFGSDAILGGAAALMVGIATAIIVGARLGRPAVATAAAVAVGVAVIGVGRVADAHAPCTIETQYVCLTIDQVAGTNEFHIRSNLYSSSYTDTDDPTNLRMAYARDVAAAIDVVAPDANEFVMIGGGGETLVRYIATTRPTATQTVFEIDALLADSVHEELGPYSGDDRVDTVIGDARVELERVDRADVVIGDAFSGLSVPWHLTTFEFLDALATRLGDRGVYVMNVVDAGDYRLARSELATLRAVFDHVVMLSRPATLDGDGPSTNLVLVASNRAIPIFDLEVSARNLGSTSNVVSGAGLDAFVDGAPALTDDHAPTDQLVDER